MDDKTLSLQYEILTSKTSDNPEMIYNTSLFSNTGLNPEYFSSYSSKIVNAINNTYYFAKTANDSISSFADKYNNILIDPESKIGKEKWLLLKEKMNENTIVEGLLNLYDNQVINLDIASNEELIQMYNSISFEEGDD